MNRSVTSLVLLFIGVASYLCQGIMLVGEEKRQGLIPFPRVGRTFNSWLPSAAALLRSELDNLQDDVSSYAPDDDVYPVPSYARGDLYTTSQLGRKKRAADSYNSVNSQSGASKHFLNDQDITDLGNMLRMTPWAVLAYKNGLDQHMTVNPNLGHSKDERSSSNKATHRPSRSSFYDNGDHGTFDETTALKATHSSAPNRAGTQRFVNPYLASLQYDVTK